MTHSLKTRMILSIFINTVFFRHNAIAQLDSIKHEHNFNMHWEAKKIVWLYHDFHFIVV